MAQQEGYSVDPITREDLDTALDKQAEKIEKFNEALISPIKKEQDEVRLILSGASRVNGLVGATKTLAVQVKIIYVVMGSLIIKLLHDLIKH